MSHRLEFYRLKGSQEPLSFGQVFRYLRKERKMSQEEVAQKSGCTRQTIARLERGEGVDTTLMFKAVKAINYVIHIDHWGDGTAEYKKALEEDSDE